MLIIIAFTLETDTLWDFFLYARCASFHTHDSLYSSIFFCSYVLFNTCCSHARVFRKTLVHEFLICYSHTEWYLLFRGAKWSLLEPKLSKTTP